MFGLRHLHLLVCFPMLFLATWLIASWVVKMGAPREWGPWQNASVAPSPLLLVALLMHALMSTCCNLQLNKYSVHTGTHPHTHKDTDPWTLNIYEVTWASTCSQTHTHTHTVYTQNTHRRRQTYTYTQIGMYVKQEVAYTGMYNISQKIYRLLN